MKRIKVNVSKEYEVIVEKGAINKVAEYATQVCDSNRVVIITDDIVEELFGKLLKDNFEGNGFDTLTFVLKNGESSKNINTLSNILEFLAENTIRRNDTLIALGGGVVGDITGLAAAIYMRGIKVIQIPTTLLAMVDSSVGGKTAIDLKSGKNLIGAFWQPSMVICDSEIAENLPNNILAEGMAEVIKCNVIKNLPIIERIQAGTLKDNIEETIIQCVELKRDVVEQDEYDNKGIRNILNVGHTVAHAIEKLSDYQISHGRAVGTGLIVESEIAKRMGLCNPLVAEKIKSAVQAFELVVNLRWSNEEIVNAMKSDKKNKDDLIVFELPYELGNCKEKKLNRQDIVDNL